MDSHQLAKGRNKSVEEILNQISIPTLVMGISSDILCPPQEQQFLAKHIPTTEYHEIDSEFGHDGFLIESDKIGSILLDWMSQKTIYFFLPNEINTLFTFYFNHNNFFSARQF
ncbi:hypothetical protein [Faecalibacter sp. LW9]|uniref:hypothetical protein n=1 Tax=Faecalibacter sp. LW9 TaxID=3103144 RepID=UPI002AFEFBF5|nr:hypothetical protein [Faecalibacter sp. LW9]